MEMKPAGTDPTGSPGSEPTYMSLGPPFPWPCPPDVRLCGHLRKQKSQRRRFFVLRADPPRLECYESQKKFLAGGCRPPRPRRSVSLEGACTISKRADARQRHLIVVYTSDSSLGVAAANEAEQQAWYSALLEVRAAAAAAAAAATMGPCSQEDPESWIFAPFQDVWPVTLRPKGLGRVRGLSSGSYRLCLGSGALSLLRKPGSKGSRDSRASPPTPALRLSLLSVRRCGHADSFFFLELGRSAPTGPGELWLQAPDAVVAQSIHETVLAAMKRLGRGATCGKAELQTRDPPPSTSTSSVPTPYETPASAVRLRCREERAEQDYLKTLDRLGATAPYPKGLDQGGGYITMGARADYVHMGGREMSDYMLMAPPDPPPIPARVAPIEPLEDPEGTEYMPMNRFSPKSLPSTFKAREPEPEFGDIYCSMGDSWGPMEAQPCSPQLADLAGDYEYIPDYVGIGTARRAPLDSCLNYVDLDLVPPLEVHGTAPRDSPHTYASIEF